MGHHEKAVEQWTTAMGVAADAELSAILSAADASRDFASVVRAIAAKRLARLTEARSGGRYVPAINFARAHLRMGNTEHALEWLKTSCEERNVYSLMIGSD